MIFIFFLLHSWFSLFSFHLHHPHVCTSAQQEFFQCEGRRTKFGFWWINSSFWLCFFEWELLPHVSLLACILELQCVCSFYLITSMCVRFAYLWCKSMLQGVIWHLYKQLLSSCLLLFSVTPSVDLSPLSVRARSGFSNRQGSQRQSCTYHFEAAIFFLLPVITGVAATHMDKFLLLCSLSLPPVVCDCVDSVFKREREVVMWDRGTPA